MMKAAEFCARLMDIARNRKTIYVMGAFGAPMTEKNKERYCNFKNLTRWSKIRAASPDTFGFDCVCLIKGILWGWEGDAGQVYGGAVYLANDVPDLGADQVIKRCEGVSTDFSAIVPGAAVWMSGHIGVYVGEGLVVESTSKWAGKVQISTLGNVLQAKLPGTAGTRKWTKWGLLPWVDYSTLQGGKTCTYSYQDGIHTVKVRADKIRVVMTDCVKTAVPLAGYANAGFFGYNRITGHTGPVSLLRCDLGPRADIGAAVLAESTVEDGKLTHETAAYDDQFRGRAQSCLIIEDNLARIREVTEVPKFCSYCVAGVPVMRNGKDVPFSTMVTGQGWDGSELRATWHTLAALREGEPGWVYILGLRTTSANLVRSSEVYVKLKALGYSDAVKLDGGDSHIIRVDGRTVSSCGSARQINSVLTWDPPPAPEKAPEKEEDPEKTEGGGVYVVQRGDTLSSIARQFGTTWQELARLNGLDDPNLIKKGQLIRLP